MTGLGKYFWLAVFLVVPFTSGAQSRRAILVGIDDYNPNSSERARLERQPVSTAIQRPKVEGDATYWRFENLDGGINDIALMKSTLTDLGVTDFVILQNQDATAAAILGALRKNLIDDAKPGDVRIFYYSGHGNHVRNLASAEQGGEDQTIVPADNWRDVPDVRDKEISRILWQSARKGVKVTFIADSCHSGSLSRGAWNASGKARSSSGRRGGSGANAPREPVANDPPEIDPATKRPIDPEKAGVLTLAAAQSSEEAREIDTEDGPHGAFTWALAHALKYEGEPMDRVFQRLAAQLHSSGVPQQPVMGGAGRAAEDLFGQPANDSAGLRLLAESVNGKDVRLRGGKELGLYPDCILKSTAKPPVKLRITVSSELGASTAQIVGEGAVKAGDLFSVERWVTPSKANLKVFLPPSAPAETVRATVAEMAKLRSDAAVEWLADPTAGQPTHIMSWNGSSWILETNPAQGKSADLGGAPAAGAVKALLPAHARFLLIAPPTPEMIAALTPATSVERVKQRADAHYWLCGRSIGEALEYAWLLPDATEETVRQMAGRLPLPLRSDWVANSADTSAKLNEKARALARIRGWLTLESPPSQGAFPYRLALRNADSGEFHTAGDARDGENYKLYLKADEAELKSAKILSRRWVYVFTIDSFGECTLLYPETGRGNEGNLQPYTMVNEQPKFEPLIELPGANFSIAPPFGVDSYFLLTTQDAIDPSVFTAEGVRTKAGTRGGAATDALSQMLSDVNTGTRAAKRVETPGTWSIELLTIRSVAK
ncbi:MAG: caspase family protein [Bryobacteraceae bacterium]|jgi:Caspase domain